MAQPRPASPTDASVLLTIEGKVEVARAGGAVWTAAETNQLLNAGDRVRAGSRSRATIRLLDLSVLRVNELTTLEIRPPGEPGKRMLLDLKAGRSYLFNREKPTELQFRTPLASGAIRGTEFELSVADADGRTVLTLLEGAVALSSGANEITLASGEQGIVEPGQAPRKAPVINAINIIQWTLYYPAVVAVEDLSLSDADRQTLVDSISAYRSGDLLAALALYPANRQPATEGERIYRAALLLAAGQVDQVEATLPVSPLADAVRKVIAAVRNESVSSANAPRLLSGTEWLAESYYLQSRSKLREALAAARTATEKTPAFGSAWVRLAELEASHGHTREAMVALEEGLRLSPRHAAGLALKGFLLTAQNKTDEALKFFDEAIALDGGLGNAWLGRGLCRIRRGDHAGGRADLQVAATLESNRAVLRSYLGKAFTNTRDEERAERELNLAKKLDPPDPTAWLYSALLKQQQNRVNEAIVDLEQSKELNENRSVFRSQFGLDQDRAVRRANLAGIYRDAGMFDWSVREAARAVSDDYGNYSAHLFLANSFDALRDPNLINLRYETAWFSELLIADLLAPASAGTFPLTTSQEQYARFFERNHVGFVTDSEYLTHGDWLARGAQYGIVGNTSWAVDVLYQTNRGYRVNNSVERLALSAKVKQQVTPEDTLYVQAQLFESKSGDLAQYFNQSASSANLRITERQEPNLFAGWHHEWGPGVHTLFLGGWLNDDFDLHDTNKIFNLLRLNGNLVGAPRLTRDISYETDFEAGTGELQQIFQNQRHTLIFGGRVQSGSADIHSRISSLSITGPPFINDSVSVQLDRYSGYGYWFWQIVPPVQLQAGVSYDYLNYPANSSLPPFSDGQKHKDQVSPKAGFYLTPLPDTTLRGRYSRSLGGVYYDTSVRLEPTQLGGFNQAFRSLAPESIVGVVPATEFDSFGLALDQKFKTRTYVTVGGELLYSTGARDVGAYATVITSGVLTPLENQKSSLRETIHFRERALFATVNQLVGDHWSFGVSYRFADSDLQRRLPELLPLSATTARVDDSATLQQVQLLANYYLRCGFFARWESTWWHQHNFGFSPSDRVSDFWQHSIAAGYRFLQRRGEVQVALMNIFDQNYRLSPLTLYNELPRERTLAVRLKLYF
jgi:tetratricopeptide (TPR) repeat protein